ncbi:MAG: 6-carboxytetrahydropterin synthase [bacterium]
MVAIIRRETFSASHRLHNPELSAEANCALYDICNNRYGHGHNYVLDVVVEGQPDPETGYVMDLKILRDVIRDEIIAWVDHKHLNYDVPWLRGLIPTAENLAIAFWQRLEPQLQSRWGTLSLIRLAESDANLVEYRGEPIPGWPPLKQEEQAWDQAPVEA